MPHRPDDTERVNTETARRLLEHATALEVDGPTLRQLREAATEAGISDAAFNRAVHAWRERSRGERAESPSLASEGRGHQPTMLWRNAAALATGVASAAVTFGISDLVTAGGSDHWMLEKLAAPAALGVMAYVTSRFRARVLTTIAAGLALSQGVEFLLDLANGAPAIHGFRPHMALMVGGIAAAFAAGSFRGGFPWIKASRNHHGADVLDEQSMHSDQAVSGSPTRDAPNVRLRVTGFGTDGYEVPLHA